MSTAFQSDAFQSNAWQILAGTAGASIEVPDVVGLTQEDGTTALEAEGFVVVVVEVDSSQDAGTIVSQEPSAGSIALLGATVTISVSLGASKFYKKFRRKYAVWIGGVKYLGAQEDFERLVETTFSETPEAELPEIRVELPRRDRFDDSAKKLEAELETALRQVYQRAYEMREEEDILKFL